MNPIWTSPDGKGLFDATVPGDWKKCSEIVGNVLDTGSTLEDIRTSLGIHVSQVDVNQIAVCAAAIGYPYALLVRMRRNLKERDPGNVTRLFDLYYSFLRQLCGRVRRHNEAVPSGGSSPPWPEPFISQSLLALAISAFVMRNDSHSLMHALHLVLKIHADDPSLLRLHHHNLLSHISRIPLKRAEKARAKDYVIRICTALSTKLSILPSSEPGVPISASLHIKDYVSQLIKELGSTSSLIVLSPPSVSYHRPVLLEANFLGQVFGLLLRDGKIELGRELSEAIDTNDTSSPLTVWDSLIKLPPEMRDGYRVSQVWDMLQPIRVSPKALAYERLLVTLFDQGRVDDARDLFRLFQEHMNAGSVDAHGPVAVDMYNKVLEGLVKNSRMEEAYKLLGEMKEFGPKPNEQSFTLFFDYAQSQDRYTLVRLAGEMQKIGPHLTPAHAKHLSVLHEYSQRRLGFSSGTVRVRFRHRRVPHWKSSGCLRPGYVP